MSASVYFEAVVSFQTWFGLVGCFNLGLSRVHLEAVVPFRSCSPLLPVYRGASFTFNTTHTFITTPQDISSMVHSVSPQEILQSLIISHTAASITSPPTHQHASSSALAPPPTAASPKAIPRGKTNTNSRNPPPGSNLISLTSSA